MDNTPEEDYNDVILCQPLKGPSADGKDQPAVADTRLTYYEDILTRHVSRLNRASRTLHINCSKSCPWGGAAQTFTP